MRKSIFFVLVLSLASFVFAQEVSDIEETQVENPVEMQIEETVGEVMSAEEDANEDAPSEEVDVREDTSEEEDAEELAELAEPEENLEEEIKALYLEKFKAAKDRKETVALELEQQLAIQKVKDERRLLEDAVYEARRSDEENAELLRNVSSLEMLLNERKEEFAEKSGAEEYIAAVEEIKAKIWDLREEVRVQSEGYNKRRDSQANLKIQEITEAPYVESETSSTGEPTRTAQQRRTNLCNEELAAALADEEEYLKALNSDIAPMEREYFSELRRAYQAVDSGKYVTTSFSDDIILRVEEFNGEKGIWHVIITSGIFGYSNLIELEFDLTYEEVTGKKFLTADLLTEEEFVQFKADVALYDHLFRINSNVVFAKVYYEVKHWKEASEYRIIPRKIEIVRAGETPKVLHKETRIQGKNFINYAAPVYEVRSEEGIRKDVERAAKINEREQKKAGVYNPAYAYNSNGTKELVPQKGRGAVCISGVTDLAVGGSDKVSLDSLGVEATFGLGKFGFIGGDFGIEWPFLTEQIMEYGLVGGANVRLGRFVRPYAKATANITNTYYGKVKAGAGVDFTFGLFMLNFGYDYSWNFDFNNHFNPAIDKSALTEEDFKVGVSNSNRFSVGLGISF